MRPARDLLLAVASPGARASSHAFSDWELQPVGAVDPWHAPASAAFPAPLSDLERLRLTQERRPWRLLGKVLCAWLMVWFGAWFVFHIATQPTHSQRKATEVTQVIGPGGPV
jgi:hypothetical protein